MDWLRNLQIRFVSEKNSDILDISDLGMVSNNEKIKDVYMDISYLFCGKFGQWEYNCKNNLARLKQGTCVASKDVYMIQTYFFIEWLKLWYLGIRYQLCNSIFVIHYNDYRISKVWKEVTSSFMVQVESPLAQRLWKSVCLIYLWIKF